MSKLKTNSSAKKRFKITANGKIRATQAGKSHFMRRRSKDQIRNLRGTTIIEGKQAKNIVKYFLPNG